MPVQIHFQCTLDDYIEANTGAPPQTKKGMAWRFIKAFGGWLMFGVAILVLVRVFRSGPAPAPVEEPTPFPYLRLFWVMLLPMALIAVLLLLIVRQERSPTKPWDVPLPREARRAKATPWQVIGCIIFIVVGVTLLLSYQLFSPALNRLPPYMEFLLPLAPLVTVLVLGMMRTRSMLAQQWKAQPQEQEPRTLTAREEGILIEQPSARLEYRWQGFTGYRETENLILLYISIYRFFIIPKRAFHDPQTLFQFKGLVMSHIPEGRFLDLPRPAFPVLATPPAEPLAGEPSAPVSNAADPSAR